MKVFDGITAGKWFDIFTDEEPTRPNFFLGSVHYKALPNKCRDAMVSTGYLYTGAI
jgi:hypothetical protein